MGEMEVAEARPSFSGVTGTRDCRGNGVDMGPYAQPASESTAANTITAVLRQALNSAILLPVSLRTRLHRGKAFEIWKRALAGGQQGGVQRSTLTKAGFGRIMEVAWACTVGGLPGQHSRGASRRSTDANHRTVARDERHGRHSVDKPEAPHHRLAR